MLTHTQTHTRTHTHRHTLTHPLTNFFAHRMDVEILSEEGDVIVATLQANPDKEKFPLKMRDEIINIGFLFLNSKGLVPQEDESDDDFDLAYEDYSIEW